MISILFSIHRDSIRILEREGQLKTVLLDSKSQYLLYTIEYPDQLYIINLLTML